jgi:succinate dehydrogenase/fumarate reductase cytochrome b subunit
MERPLSPFMFPIWYRFQIWDAGYGFEIRQAYHSGYAVLAATALLTMLAWLFTKTCGPSL